MDEWEMERAIRRANGEKVSDGSCATCLGIGMFILLVGFLVLLLT